ncbi:MAG: metallophosphoesterase [Clostridiales bacterium]|nr:metallophosphoesterase [Clostridiales bacterium]MCC8065660.1 metallophosphoesterase [Clostridiales bacterium]
MRFMHLADVHLGAAPDHGYVWSKDRGRELWETFRQCIADAKEKKVDLLLIAGDLFHRQPEPRELKEVNYLFSTLDNTVVVLMAGNHDCLTPGSPYRDYPWNENVVCMFAKECERVRLPDLKTEIYGFSYYEQELPMPLYDNIVVEKNDYFKILLAHGGDARHIPISREKLSAAGFDYIALGHIHKPQVFIRNLAMYAGALEPIDREDVGPHGYLIGEVQRKKVKLIFVEKARRQYRKEEVAVTEEDTTFSVREKIAAMIHEKGSQDTYQIVLTGLRHPGFRPDIGEYLKCGRILEIEDRTAPAFHLEELRQRYRGGLIGNYIESFGDGPESLVEQKALMLGLEALLYPENC